jgi:PIN domain nuclease of toxin-antitoxin system
VKRVLLDTECWLWWHLCPERLGAAALAAFEERRAVLLLSAVSSWEIVIKQTLGKLRLPVPAERFVPEQMAEDGIDPMPIQHAHALHVAKLPPHHADPFDRLLVAQAQVERCSLLTADAQLLAYDVDVMWAGRRSPPRSRRRRR